MTSQSEGLSALHQIIEGSNVSKAQLKHLLHQFVDKFCIDEKTVAVGQELLDATRDLTIEKVSQVADPKAGKKKKEIQFDKCRFRHIALQIQYDGSKYHGFASQESTETVENCLFDVLVKLKLIEDAKNCQYTRCGRTDKGVSAMGQIVALKIRSAISPNIPDEFVPLNPGDIINYPIEENHKTLSSTSASLAVTPSSDPTNVSKSFKTLQEMDYCTMINALLPEDIRIIGWSPVTDNFSSRFSATYRTYRYFFHKENLNISSMITACSYLIGSHDFRNFCKLDIANVTNFIREIFSAEIICYQENYIKPELSIYYLQIKGIAFLWHMVRCIMSVLFLIGEEKEEPSIIHHLFNVEKYPSKPSYAMADDAPLVLQKCGFDNLVIYHTPKTLWNLTNHYQQLRNKYLLAAARAQNAVDTLYSEAAVRSQDLEPFLLHLKDLKEGRKDNRNHPSQKNLKNQNKRKFDDLLPSENSLDTTPMVVENTAADFISWKETLQKIYEETRLSPSEKTSQYIPLLERKKEESYEERVNKLAGQKKERFDRHIDLSESAKDTTPQFFDTMRKEGTLLRENR